MGWEKSGKDPDILRLGEVDVLMFPRGHDPQVIRKSREGLLEFENVPVIELCDSSETNNDMNQINSLGDKKQDKTLMELVAAESVKQVGFDNSMLVRVRIGSTRFGSHYQHDTASFNRTHIHDEKRDRKCASINLSLMSNNCTKSCQIGVVLLQNIALLARSVSVYRPDSCSNLNWQTY